MIRNLLALTGLLAIALVSAIGLQAYGTFDDEAPRRVRVSYAGLDLASPEGLRILEQRVNAAINDVCRDYDGRELWRSSGRRQCREDAIAGVVPQVNYAVDRARRGRAEVIADGQEGPPPPDYYAEPPARPAPPPPPPAYTPPADEPPMHLVKRTVVTTRTVTTTRPGPPPPLPRPLRAPHRARSRPQSRCMSARSPTAGCPSSLARGSRRSRTARSTARSCAPSAPAAPPSGQSKTGPAM